MKVFLSEQFDSNLCLVQSESRSGSGRIPDLFAGPRTYFAGPRTYFAGSRTYFAGSRQKRPT